MSRRPERDADQLRRVADHLDVADEAFKHLARLLGQPNPVTGNGMQVDVRRIADRLDNLDGGGES